MQNSLQFEVTSSYSRVRATPLLLANELNIKLEQWFQNCKYLYLAINKLSEEEFSEKLQLEYTYPCPLRTQPIRGFDQIRNELITEIDLLNYHQLVKIIHEYIEQSYRIYISLTEPEDGKSIIDFELRVNSLCKEFHKRNFPDKLLTISSKLNLTNSLDIINKINKIRNCLEHRYGVVAEEDCDADRKYMSIQWYYPKIESEKGINSPLSNVEGEQNIKIVFDDEIKSFQQGSKISFDFDDNTKCIFSINTCFKTIVDGIYNIVNVNQSANETIIREFKIG